MRRVLCAALAAVAVGAVAAAWFEAVPDITGEEAVDAADQAFADAGIVAEVEPTPSAERYATSARGSVEVWRVRATVRASPVDVLLARSGAQPVSIDDRAANGASYLLSEVEYDAVARAIQDPALDRAVRRNSGLTVAAVLVVALAIGLAAIPQPEEPR
ncbi:MAG: hypothetical protein ABL966_00060 [Acidimicrobiales bacterium]